ncbi:Phage shock protein A [Caenispirillum salinarum AK4]|uniref:Phage shock protein A n=1 Tax=Caenispirillum salinarum AK4 TaxID=1238182 RepID=K9GTW1_9PROT|nr:phage shock protein PspA [Caenispirillum salinarum]EKV28597.1 Phage shock protein A [Caenispirillum salinarum AK4]
MGIFSRLSDIVNSNINSMLERAKDPEKIIRLIIQEMEDTLVEVRSSSVRYIAEKKDLERRIARLEDEHAEWAEKAELALRKDREDLARGALAAKAKAAEAIKALKQELVNIDDALARQSEDLARLQDKLADAKAREQALKTRHSVASNRLKMRSQIHDDRMGDAFRRFEQVERDLDEMEGKVESYDLGRKQQKSLADEFADLETNDAVEDELARLKAKVKSGGEG